MIKEFIKRLLFSKQEIEEIESNQLNDKQRELLSMGGKLSQKDRDNVAKEIDIWMRSMGYIPYSAKGKVTRKKKKKSEVGVPEQISRGGRL